MNEQARVLTAVLSYIIWFKATPVLACSSCSASHRQNHLKYPVC